MKRALVVIPYVGFVLVLVALCVRGFRDEGLALEPFPAPPRVTLPALEGSAPPASISGTVVDAEDRPVAEALVLAVHEGEPSWAYTDPQGKFELLRVPEGNVELDVIAREYQPGLFPLQAPAAEVQLKIGERVGPAPAPPEMARDDLEGQVIASFAGRVLLGYEVLLVPTIPPHEFGAPVPVRGEVGANRTFHFPALIHGEYRVVILPPWARGATWPNLCEPGRRTYTHGPASGKLELPMSCGEIHGRLIDRRGKFLEGVMILLTPESAPERPWPPSQSNQYGSFEVRDLPPGTYRLEIYAGEAHLARDVVVSPGVTSELDLPPLDVR